MQTREKVGIVWFGTAWHGMESVLSQMTYFFRQYIDKYGSLLESFFSIIQRKISVYLLLLFFFCRSITLVCLCFAFLIRSFFFNMYICFCHFRHGVGIFSNHSAYYFHIVSYWCYKMSKQYFWQQKWELVNGPHKCV